MTFLKEKLPHLYDEVRAHYNYKPEDYVSETIALDYAEKKIKRLQEDFQELFFELQNAKDESVKYMAGMGSYAVHNRALCDRLAAAKTHLVMLMDYYEKHIAKTGSWLESAEFAAETVLEDLQSLKELL